MLACAEVSAFSKHAESHVLALFVKLLDWRLSACFAAEVTILCMLTPMFIWAEAAG